MRHEVDGLADQHGIAERHRVVAGQVQLVDRRRPVPLHGRVRDVLGQVDQDRSRPPGGGDVEGGGDHLRDVIDVLDEPVVLGDAHGDAGDVALLEGVGSDGTRRHLTGHDDQRRRVHVGVGERRHDVGGARAARHHGDAGTAGGHGVPLGHVTGALLVADQDVADGRVDDRVVDGQDGAAGQAEHDVDPLHLEALDEGLGPGHLHVLPSLLCRAAAAVVRWRFCPELKRPPGSGRS